MTQYEVVTLFRPQAYFRADSIVEVCKFLQEHENSAIVAGGTDLLVEKPPRIRSLIDITKLSLDYIEVDDQGVRIGACATFRKIEREAILRKQPYSSLVEALRTIGGIALRNEATIGGNVCNAVPSADTPPPLMSLDSRVKIVSQQGERAIDLQDFFLHVRKTALKTEEFVTEFQIPKPPNRTGTSFLKLGRSAHDIAVVNVATRITFGQGKELEDVRIVLGAVAPTPLRARKAEHRLISHGSDAISEAASVAAEEIKPISDVRASAEYRKAMAAVLTRRALTIAFERAGVT